MSRPTKAQREAELAAAFQRGCRVGYAQALADTGPVVPDWIDPDKASELRFNFASAYAAKAAEKFPDKSDG